MKKLKNKKSLQKQSKIRHIKPKFEEHVRPASDLIKSPPTPYGNYSKVKV